MGLLYKNHEKNMTKTFTSMFVYLLAIGYRFY